jgi:hypothetical protein
VARNRYFNQYAPIKKEQNLVEDLIIESIKIYGVDVYYLPRTHVNLDRLYAEDASMRFTDALEMEMYIKSFDGFQGQEDFLSKFGLQIDEQIVFVVAQKRFNQALKSCFLTEYSYNIAMEDGGELIQESAYDYESIIRPREGDLLWFPMAGYMYEVKFTENIENFYQLGKLYTYELRCERYEYSSEKLDTGIPEIDNVEETYSQESEFVPKVLAEDDVLLLNEDGTYIVWDEINIERQDVSAENEYIQTKIGEDDILDFSERNPFSEVRVY